LVSGSAEIDFKRIHMNTILVDDDEMSAGLLRHLIENVSYINLLKTCTCPLEAVDVLRNEEIDLLFLDIEMPRLNGMDLIKSLATPPLIILTTSHEHYAFKAFEHNVVDYLLKPVELPRFMRATAKAKEIYDHSHGGSPDVFNQDYIFIRKNSILNKVLIKEILWIEALGDYVTVHTPEKNYTLHITLKALEKKLPVTRFVRVHRSFIVQLEQINTIDDSVISINNKAIPVGALYRENFMKRLNLLY
jgi:DNA-binding LytR/AlgR family response regulator